MRAENAAITELNIQRDQQAAQLLIEEEERAKLEREERARELRMEEAHEREEIERSKVALINDLERSSGDAAKVVAKSRAETQKRIASQRPLALSQSASNARLLRTRAQASISIPDVPHVPFTDQVSSYDDRFAMQAQYTDPASELVRKDSEGIMRAGGYRVEEAWGRALRVALAGLDITPLEDVELQNDTIMATS
jgi:CDK-activating kinase assembly factor MAT1